MITPEIRERYPSITEEELAQLTQEDVNKLSIAFHEQMVKDYKEMLAGLYKDRETQYPDWYKDLLREMKNQHEHTHKETVFAQRYLREGLNPPFCYPKSEDNPYGFTKRKQ